MSLVVPGLTGDPMVLVATWPDGSQVLRMEGSWRTRATRRFLYCGEDDLGFSFELDPYDCVFSHGVWPYDQARSVRIVEKFRWLLSSVGLDQPFPAGKVFLSPALHDDPKLLGLSEPVPPADDPSLSRLVERADEIVALLRDRSVRIGRSVLYGEPEEKELEELLSDLAATSGMSKRLFSSAYRLELQAHQKHKSSDPQVWTRAVLVDPDGSHVWEKVGSLASIFAELRSGGPLRGKYAPDSFVLIPVEQIPGWVEARWAPGELSVPDVVPLFQMLGEPSPYLLPWEKVLAWASSQ